MTTLLGSMFLIQIVCSFYLILSQGEHDQRGFAQVRGERGHAPRALHASQGRKGRSRSGQPQQNLANARQAQRSANAEQDLFGAAQGPSQAGGTPQRGEQAAAYVHKRLQERERPACQAARYCERQAEETGARARKAQDYGPVSAK